MIWNPVPHMRHAWSGANTIWGKLALVLFYSLIWVTIISAVWSIIDPTSQGTACYTNLIDKDAAELVFVLVRGLNIILVGFMLYADVGGLQTKNVAMVTVIFVWYCVTVLVALPRTPEIFNECTKGIYIQIYVFMVWPIVALIFCILQDKLGGDGGGSAEENRPLTA